MLRRHLENQVYSALLGYNVENLHAKMLRHGARILFFLLKYDQPPL
jgi:hypothetical protein